MKTLIAMMVLGVTYVVIPRPQPPRVITIQVTNDFTGTVLAFDSKAKEIKLRLLSGEIVILHYHPNTRWVNEWGERADLTIFVNVTKIHYLDGIITVLRP